MVWTVIINLENKMFRSLFELALLSAIVMKGVTAQDDDVEELEDLLEELEDALEELVEEDLDEVFANLDWKLAIEGIGYEAEEFYV